MSKLLIGGDFSGIQPYLYQVISKNANKALKGRSFYLKLLSDAVTKYLLWNISDSRLIYSSGGCLYIEAPDTEAVNQQLVQLRNDIEQKMFDKHAGILFVAIDWIQIPDNIGNDLPKYWTELFQKRDKLKRHRLCNIIKRKYDVFFNPSNPEIEQDDNNIEIRIGKKLKTTTHIFISSKKLILPCEALLVNPIELNVFFYLLDENDYNKSKYVLDDEEIEDWNLGDTPLNTGKTFEQLCDEGKTDFTRMGVLRMDVDNLGTIFQNAANKPNPQMEDYGKLSKQLDAFFTNELNKLYNNLDPQHSFIVYSGGDDVFAVGRWDVMIKFAEIIQQKFRQFMNNDSMYSISGGISIVEPKFPIMRAALYSGEEEDNAKQHCQKNSISFMGTPLRWDDEYVVVKKLKDDLVELLKFDKLDKSFLQKIMKHQSNAGIKEHRITSLKTYWMITYDLCRMKSRKNDSVVNVIIDNCINEICNKKSTLNGTDLQTDYHPLELWAFAARWAELEYRSNQH